MKRKSPFSTPQLFWDDSLFYFDCNGSRFRVTQSKHKKYCFSRQLCFFCRPLPYTHSDKSFTPDMYGDGCFTEIENVFCSSNILDEIKFIIDKVDLIDLKNKIYSSYIDKLENVLGEGSRLDIISSTFDLNISVSSYYYPELDSENAQLKLSYLVCQLNSLFTLVKQKRF